MEKGILLKLVSNTNGIAYYKVIDVETTACSVLENCQIRNGTVHFKYRSQVKGNIYKSEIGSPYYEVEKEEQACLRKMIQKK